MCGMCGILTGNMSRAEVDAFKLLLFFCQTRGEDSTGVLSVKKPSDKDTRKDRPLRIQVRREAAEASTFLNYNWTKDKEQIFDTSSIMLGGHCRAATIGSIKAVNAHPFTFDNVVGMHNGTVSIPFKGDKNFETDSEAIYALINEIGFEATMNEIESFSQTAYALVWVDKKQKTLNFFRNDRRPLYFSELYSGSTKVWASEPWMLSVMTQKKFAGMECKPVALPVHELHTYDLTASHKALVTPEVKKFIPKSKTYSYQGNHSGPFHRTPRTDGPAGTKGRVWDSQTKSFREPTDEDLLPWNGAHTPLIENHSSVNPMTGSVFGHGKATFRGFNDAVLTKATFQSLMDEGCSYCQGQQDIDTPNVEFRIGWVDHEHYICVDCMESEKSKKDMLDYFVAYRVQPN